MARQHGDSVLKLRALHADAGELGHHRLKLCLRGHHVGREIVPALYWLVVVCNAR